MLTDLHHHTAVITGGGSGIGRAVAVKLAASGMRLVLLGGRRRDALEQAAKELSSHTEVLTIPGDLSDFSQYPVWERQIRDFGPAEMLLNNAGMAQHTSFADITPTELENIMRVNFEVPFRLTQLLLPQLLASGVATVVNIASVVAHAGYPEQSAYTASKHALLGFTKSLAAEYYEKGLRVHAISPGGVYTDMVKLSRPDLTPEGMILPEEIADWVLFLLQHRSCSGVVDEIAIHRLHKPPFGI